MIAVRKEPFKWDIIMGTLSNYLYDTQRTLWGKMQFLHILKMEIGLKYG